MRKRRRRPRRPESKFTPPAPLPAQSPAPRQWPKPPLLPLVIAAVLFVIVFGPSIDADLDLTDDHEILRFSSSTPLHPDLSPGFGPIQSVWEIAVTRDISQGRFRPIYYFHRFAEVALFGRHSATWHTARLVMGLLTCLAFVTAFHLMTGSSLGALFFFVWLAFQLQSTEIWVRLGPAETLAVLFLSLAAFAGVVASLKAKSGWWDYAALAAMALMTLSKETFVLVIPSLLLIRLLLEWRRTRAGWMETIRGIWRPLLAGCVLFAAQLAIIFSVYQGGGVGAAVVGQLSNPYSPAHWVEMLWLMKMRFAYYLPLGVAALLMVYDLVRRRQTPLLELGSLAIAGIWVIPQLTLLIPAWVEARYMYPAVIGIAGINALALVWIGQRSRRLMLVCAAACAVVGLLMGMRTNIYATNFTSKTAVFNQMLRHVADSVPPEKAIVIYAHPGHHYEASISIVHHLGARRVASPIYLYPAGDFDITNSLALANMTRQFPGRVDTTALGDDFRQAIETRLRMSPGKDLTTEEVAVVIVQTSMDQFDKAPPAWFVADGFERRTFQSQAYQVINFRIREAWQYHHELLETRR